MAGEIAALPADSRFAGRTIGVVSLLGMERLNRSTRWCGTGAMPLIASTWPLGRQEVPAELMEQLSGLGIESLGALERVPLVV